MARFPVVLLRLVVVAGSLFLLFLPATGIAQSDPYVTVSKTATFLGGCRRYEVTLTVEGTRPPLKDADVMLVIDRSGSMNDGGNGCTLSGYSNQTSCQNAGGVWGIQPFTSVKEAAKGLVAKLQAGDKVGLVSYESSATENRALTSSHGTVTTAINSLSVDSWGRTNIGAGINLARQELADNGRSGVEKVIVVISDGVANRSQSSCSGCGIYPCASTCCTQDAVAQAGLAKTAGYSVFGIFLENVNDSDSGCTLAGVRQLGEDTMRAVASGSDFFYSTADASALAAVYEKIAGQVSPAATGLAVSDPMGSGFQVDPTSLNASAGTVSVSGQTVAWDLDLLGEETVTLTYQVTAPTADSGQILPVNGSAVMDYINSQGSSAQLTFPVPTVCVQPPDPVASFSWEETSWATYQFTDLSTPGVGTGCASGANTLSPAAGGCPIDSWLWDFGDGTTSTEQNPVHAYATGDPYDVLLTVSCECGCQDSYSDEPTAVSLTSFTATSSGQSIVLAWETASEIDTQGFNLYRAGARDGQRIRLNEGLIPSQVAPGSPVGAAYQYLDGGVDLGLEYTYWLEDVGLDGSATVHEPVSAGVFALTIDPGLWNLAKDVSETGQ